MQLINGKYWPMWTNELVDNRTQFIGGTLKDLGDKDQSAIKTTKILDISMGPDSYDGAFLQIKGADFGFKIDLQHATLEARDEMTMAIADKDGHRYHLVRNHNDHL